MFHQKRSGTKINNKTFNDKTVKTLWFNTKQLK